MTLACTSIYVVAYMYEGGVVQIMTAGYRRENVFNRIPQFGSLDRRAKSLSNGKDFRPEFPKLPHFVFAHFFILQIFQNCFLTYWNDERF